MTSKACEQCGIPINLLKSTARYCSSHCRVAAHRAKKKPAIPAQLRATDRWVRWKAERLRGRDAKVPYRVNGTGRASTTDARTWSSYADAAASSFGDGLGVVLTGDGLAVLDLDDCLVNGRPSEAAQSVLDTFPDAWVEISPSGHGLHVWGTAAAGPGRHLRLRSGLKAEFYTQARYMTITGRTYRAGDLSTPLDPARLY